MDSSYFGELSLGNGRSGSSRKGKKSNSDKPKQPQRGLGVAQLEKIRLRSEMGCCCLPSRPCPSHAHLNQGDVAMEMAFTPPSSSSSYSPSSGYGFHPNIMMGLGEMEAADIRYGEARWNHNNGILQSQQPVQTSTTPHLRGLPIEDPSLKQRKNDRCHSLGSNGQNSESSETQELDLDLKL